MGLLHALRLPVVLLSVLPLSGALQRVAEEPAAVTRAPLELALAPYAGPLRTVLATSGTQEFPLLFDTGGGGTVLALETARKLGLEPFGRLTGFRHDGGRVDGPRAGPVELAFGSFRRRGEVGVLDLGPLLGGLPPIAGIASLETFAGQALTIDLARGRLFLESPESLGTRVQGADELAVRFGRQASGAALDVFVAVEGLHGWLWFELDSGNVAPVLIAPHAFAELDLAPLSVGQVGKVELPIVGLGLVPCEAQAKELIYDGLLNAAFFERFTVSLDLAAARAWARRNG